WSQHLGLTRQLMGEAIGNLAGGFGNLNQRLLGNDQAAGSELGNRAIAAIEQAEQGLESLVQALRQTQEYRASLVREIVGIAGHTNELQSEEHTSELQSRENLVCRLLLEKKKKKKHIRTKTETALQ